MTDNPSCDALTGICTPAPLAPDAATVTPVLDQELIYVGDPMCSACWGLAPELSSLKRWAAERDLAFTVLVGGLRPGGGDAWTADFRGFLRHEWETLAARTGQPFNTAFLDRDAFEYDTEPACRAVVVAGELLDDVYPFFASIQRRFYAENEDPTQPAFYDAVCRAHGLDVNTFRQRFESDEARAATRAEMLRARRLGARAFPTVLFRDGADVHTIAVGLATADAMASTTTTLMR